MSNLSNYFDEIYNTNPNLLKENTLKIQEFCKEASVPPEGDNNDLTHRVKALGAPIAYSETAYNDFEKLCNEFYKIFTSIIDAYKKDEDIRTAFNYDTEIEKLILAETYYSNLLPMARFDIFYNPDTRDYKFIEINTDGTACQSENDVLNQSLGINKVFLDKLSTCGFTYQQFDYYTLWIKSLIEIYNEFLENKESQGNSTFNSTPCIGIVDFIDKAYLSDFVEFKIRFEKAGYETHICDITKMKYDGKMLYDEHGHKIDVIYRRAVTADVLSSLNKCQPLINAYLDGNVCLVGGFNTQLIHNKTIFALLSSTKFLGLLQEKNYLDNEQIELIKNHIPYTRIMSTTLDDMNYYKATEADYEELVNNKNKWIIKPLDSYDGAGGIYVGETTTQEDWQDIITKCKATNEYLFQEYNKQSSMINYEVIDDELVRQEYNVMPGLYMYAGKLNGMYTRVSPGKIIANAYGGYEVCSIIERKAD